MKTTSLKPKSSRRLKSFHRVLSPGTSLRWFVRSLLKGLVQVEGLNTVQLAENFFFNKKANTKHPLKGIGRTNRLSTKGSK